MCGNQEPLDPHVDNVSLAPKPQAVGEPSWGPYTSALARHPQGDHHFHRAELLRGPGLGEVRKEQRYLKPEQHKSDPEGHRGPWHCHYGARCPELKSAWWEEVLVWLLPVSRLGSQADLYGSVSRQRWNIISAAVLKVKIKRS